MLIRSMATTLVRRSVLTVQPISIRLATCLLMLSRSRMDFSHCHTPYMCCLVFTHSPIRRRMCSIIPNFGSLRRLQPIYIQRRRRRCIMYQRDFPHPRQIHVLHVVIAGNVPSLRTIYMQLQPIHGRLSPIPIINVAAYWRNDERSTFNALRHHH